MEVAAAAEIVTIQMEQNVVFRGKKVLANCPYAVHFYLFPILLPFTLIFVTFLIFVPHSFSSVFFFIGPVLVVATGFVPFRSVGFPIFTRTLYLDATFFFSSSLRPYAALEN